MPASTPVSEVMTRDVVTLRPDQSVEHAADVLAEKQIGAAPVVDAGGKLVGLLRDEDLIVSEARLHVPTVISFLGADIVLPSTTTLERDDIAHAVVFLSSDTLARHITGQTLVVDGGAYFH